MSIAVCPERLFSCDSYTWNAWSVISHLVQNSPTSEFQNPNTPSGVEMKKQIDSVNSKIPNPFEPTIEMNQDVRANTVVTFATKKNRRRTVKFDGVE